MKKNEQILLNYLNIMANRIQYLSKKIRLLGMQSIKGKLAHYFLDLEAKKGSSDFKLTNSQSEIADMFAITRPSVGRVFRELDRLGFIHARGKCIRIIDKSGLLKLRK